MSAFDPLEAVWFFTILPYEKRQDISHSDNNMVRCNPLLHVLFTISIKLPDYVRGKKGKRKSWHLATLRQLSRVLHAIRLKHRKDERG